MRMLLSLAKLLDAIPPESYVIMQAGRLPESENKKNRPLCLVCFVFPKEVPGELVPFSFPHKLCADMRVN